EKAILKNIYSYGGFRESNNDQLIPIRQLELAKQRAKVETDSALDAAAKTKALAEIDAKLAALKS
ncbi:MAG TPA: phosphonate ABC transporter substrate-binding protein, partial [Rubrivivax sp.]|nr:phosphonate ABC transporter substrate-binding protein [Rubrivivax sp.]